VLVRGSIGIASGATVELADENASLELYLCNDMTVDDGGFGVARAVARDGSKTIATVTAYSDPGRVRVFGVREADGGAGSPSYKIDTRSIVLASIHSPNAVLRVDHDGVLIGRATAKEFRLDDGDFYYDPALDPGSGFCDLNGPLYDDSEQPLTGLETVLTSFDTSLGLDGLQSWCQAKLPAFTPPDPPTKGEVAERKKERAEGRTWPMRAKAMELRISGGGEPAALRGGLVKFTESVLNTVVVGDEGDDEGPVLETLK